MTLFFTIYFLIFIYGIYFLCKKLGEKMEFFSWLKTIVIIIPISIFLMVYIIFLIFLYV
jgi:hypothetical protein